MPRLLARVERVGEPFPFDLPRAAVFLAPPLDLAPPADCLAPPDAVRLPAPPLFVAVDVFEPPDREEVADFAAAALVLAFLAVPGDFEAPVLLALDDLDAELLFAPPVLEVADLFPP